MTTDTDTDKARPTLKLFDATGGLAGPFLLADTDEFDAERLHFLYVTSGAAQDLIPTMTRETIISNNHNSDVARTSVVLSAANYWGIYNIESVLGPVPEGALVDANIEYWKGRDGWTLDQYACAMARFKAARPDIQWSLYAAYKGRHMDEYDATKQFTSFMTASVFPGIWADASLRRVESLMKRDPDALVTTGWSKGIKNSKSVEPTEAEFRDNIRRMFKVGVTNLGIWMGPPKPGVHLRLPDMILPMARMAREVFAEVHGVKSDVDPDAAGSEVAS